MARQDRNIVLAETRRASRDEGGWAEELSSHCGSGAVGTGDPSQGGRRFPRPFLRNNIQFRFGRNSRPGQTFSESHDEHVIACYWRSSESPERSPSCMHRRPTRSGLRGPSLGDPVHRKTATQPMWYHRLRRCAGVAELADAPGLGPGGETREGSSPFARTIFPIPPAHNEDSCRTAARHSHAAPRVSLVNEGILFVAIELCPLAL